MEAGPREMHFAHGIPGLAGVQKSQLILNGGAGEDHQQGASAPLTGISSGQLIVPGPIDNEHSGRPPLDTKSSGVERTAPSTNGAGMGQELAEMVERARSLEAKLRLRGHRADADDLSAQIVFLTDLATDAL